MTHTKCSRNKLSDTLTMSECKDGFWLYDETRGMNLSMRAKTEEDAFVAALTYYQRRLSGMEKSYWGLSEIVNDFVANFVDEEDVV